MCIVCTLRVHCVYMVMTNSLPALTVTIVCGAIALVVAASVKVHWQRIHAECIGGIADRLQCEAIGTAFRVGGRRRSASVAPHVAARGK